MNILFIHQNFPGQYIHLVQALASEGCHRIVALGLGQPRSPLPSGLHYRRYALTRGNTQGIHLFASETEAKVIRGEACAAAAYQLASEGFHPDLICAHPGWGEALFLPDVWPHVPILFYQEFYYHPRGLDTDFDPELQGNPPWTSCAKVRMKNAYLQLTLESSHWNLSPTHFQRRTFPKHWQSKFSTIHDGIDIRAASPAVHPITVTLSDGTILNTGDPVITFVNRNLEPYRGCHSFIRAIPHIQSLYPKARIVIVGQTRGVSYGAPCPDGEWSARFLSEIAEIYDSSRVHLVGTLAYTDFLTLLKISACHVYLTYPFVLSWSLLEAMSTGCAVVGSSTAPVQELITHGYNGLLVDFFSPVDIATSAVSLLNDRALANTLGQHARQTIVSQYSLDVCLPQHLALLNMVASGSIG